MDKFISTKKSNLIDYADAAIRYLKATGLVSFNVQKLKVEILNDKIKDVEYLLKSIKREPVSFKSVDQYEEYLFDDVNVLLLTDNKEELIKKIEILIELVSDVSLKKKAKNLEKMSIEELKDLYDLLESEKTNQVVEEQKSKLQNYQDYSSILEVYNNIAEGEVADPSLVFEWNTWRAMVMLNDGDIRGNFKIDSDGSPLFTAPSKVPDIECDYKDFNMTVEVTLSRGQKQYDMEGEPVARHLGDYKRLKNKETFCLFVATNISSGTLSHFYALHHTNISYYGGKAHIIPMSVELFIKMIEHAKEKKGVKSEQIHQYLKFLVDKTSNTKDENEWFDVIKNTVGKWTEEINN